jgi:hypothetical protein
MIILFDNCSLSESDKKIQEIMDGLMFRGAAVFCEVEGLFFILICLITLISPFLYGTGSN